MTKQKRIKLLVFLTALFILNVNSALVVNLTVNKGWPCNVFLSQPNIPDAVGNFVNFNVKASPSSPSSANSFLVGEIADYINSISQTLNSRVENLPFLEPLSFNLKSRNYGAKFGVDVCIPELDVSREDVVPWTVDVQALGALMAPAGGDWFQSSLPNVSMELKATNCNGTALSNMSESDPVRNGFCEIESEPTSGNDALSVGAEPIPFSFKLMANRQAVLRFTVEEQSTQLRTWNWDAGIIQIALTDPPLPRLTVEDLLGKQLFFAAENDLLNWPACAGFTDSVGLGFDDLKLQGPNNSLELRWTGKDTDCSAGGVCPNGNVRTNQFSIPLQVFLEDGTLAPPNASPNLGVGSFIGEFDDFAASGETAYPSQGRIQFDAQQDQVFRYNGKAMFSTTVSRLVGPQNWQMCRVWFKRDNGFDCALLPDARLQNLCGAMR